MKKVLSTIMALLIATGLTACGCGNGRDNNTGAGAGADKENTAGTETGNGANNGNGGNMGNNGATNNGSNTGNGTATTKTYKDGTYTGKGEPWEYGSEEAVVTVKGGKITNIELRRLDKEGKEIDYANWTGKEVNGTTYPNLNQYRKDVAKTMIDRQ
ncbi:MAG: hypothetical protein ACI33K_04500, partial [Clostridiaceae bacterium]